MITDFSGGYSKYPIINSKFLCDDAADELEASNDSGRLVNPAYHPKFKTWLDEKGLDSTQCYIVWFSW